MKTLLLWDIDGTLIDSGGAGSRALCKALQETGGVVDDLRWLDLAGRTDVWIAQQILARHQLAASESDIRHFLGAYLHALPHQLANPRARVFPGVTAALDAMANHPGVVQGLLTGNIQAGARLKLGHFQLWSYFAFGAFADDSAHRNELGPFAVRRAAELHGMAFAAHRILIIGDTPHDIACGQAVGARTFGVATGRFSSEELKNAGADAVFLDLSDVERFVAAVEEIGATDSRGSQTDCRVTDRGAQSR